MINPMKFHYSTRPSRPGFLWGLPRCQVFARLASVHVFWNLNSFEEQTLRLAKLLQETRRPAACGFSDFSGWMPYGV
jgi:hypothetical protein